MKKILSICLIAVLTCIFSGCSHFFFYDNDDEVAMNKMVEILTAIESGQPEEIKGQFAPAILEADSHMDENIEELYSYYKGKHTSVKSAGGLYVDETLAHGKKIKNLRMAYYVTTTEEEYCFSVDWCSHDYQNSYNIGVNTLYVISREKKLDGMPWREANGKFGIQVDKPFAGIYLDKLIDVIKDNDKQKFKSLFADKAISEQEDFDDKIDTLFILFDGNYDKLNRVAEYYETETANGYDISYYALKGTIETEATFSICLRWCIESKDGDVGALSFYLAKTNGEIYMDMNNPYWGDGNWEYGVHIDFDFATQPE